MRSLSFLLLAIIAYNVFFINQLPSKILAPSPKDIEAKKKEEEKFIKNNSPKDNPKSIRDNLGVKEDIEQPYINIPKDQPQEKDLKFYDNNKDIDSINLNSTEKSNKTNEEVADINEENYNLPTVDDNYLNKSRARTNKARVNNSVSTSPIGTQTHSFSQQDLEQYTNMANPLNLSIVSNPAIVILRNSQSKPIDPNINAILYSKAERSKVTYVPVDSNPNVAMYNILNNLQYWAPNTIFAYDYDKSQEMIAIKTKSLHYFIVPNNSMISILAATIGIIDARRVNISGYMSLFKQTSYAYFYMIGQLASKEIMFVNMGEIIPKGEFKLTKYNDVLVDDTNTIISGSIIYKDNNEYITNISKDRFSELDLLVGDTIHVKISSNNKDIYNEKILYQENERNIIEKDIFFNYTNFSTLYVGNLQAHMKEVNIPLTITIVKVKKDT